MRKVIKEVARKVSDTELGRLMQRGIKPVMMRGMRWAGVLMLCLSQASLAASARDMQRFAPATTTLALPVGQTPIQDEQSRTLSVLEAAQLRGKVLPFIVGVVTVDLALASSYWGVYVPYYAEKEAPQRIGPPARKQVRHHAPKLLRCSHCSANSSKRDAIAPGRPFSLKESYRCWQPGRGYWQR